MVEVHGLYLISDPILWCCA